MAAVAFVAVFAWLILGSSEVPRGVSRSAAGPNEAVEIEIRRLLDARARALVARDEKGWLAGLDSGERLLAGQRGSYRNLRDMAVARYTYKLRSRPPARDLSTVLKTWDGRLERFYPGGRGDPAAWQAASWVVVHRLIGPVHSGQFRRLLRRGGPI